MKRAPRFAAIALALAGPMSSFALVFAAPPLAAGPSSALGVRRDSRLADRLSAVRTQVLRLEHELYSNDESTR